MRRRFDRNIALAESILVRVLALTVAFAYDLYVVLELQNQYFFGKTLFKPFSEIFMAVAGVFTTQSAIINIAKS
jgi:hypothetical protein